MSRTELLGTTVKQREANQHCPAQRDLPALCRITTSRCSPAASPTEADTGKDNQRLSFLPRGFCG